MMRIVTLCPQHQTPLIDHCPHCQKCQLVFASSKTQPGECTSCGYGLENDGWTLSAQEEIPEHRTWQKWVWGILQELQATSSRDGMIPWEAFFRHLAAYLQEQKGYSRLALATGIDRTVLYRWIDPADAYRPTLEAILKLCYVCQITPLQIMDGQLDQLQQTLQAGTERRPPLPHRQNRRFDQEQCQIALQAALESNDEPQALRQIAQQLGFEDAHQLVYHFPNECKLVTQRAKEYRLQRKAQRLAQVREQVRQAVFSAHAQGFYPSHRRLRTLLPGALMRLSEAKEAWRAALQELGYEL
jgi:transposase-like protein